MKLSKSERQVLVAVGQANRQQAPSDRQSLEELAKGGAWSVIGLGQCNCWPNRKRADVSEWAELYLD